MVTLKSQHKQNWIPLVKREREGKIEKKKERTQTCHKFTIQD